MKLIDWTFTDRFSAFRAMVESGFLDKDSNLAMLMGSIAKERGESTAHPELYNQFPVLEDQSERHRSDIMDEFDFNLVHFCALCPPKNNTASFVFAREYKHKKYIRNGLGNIIAESRAKYL